MQVLILLTFIFTAPDGSKQAEDLAIVKDAQTCDAVAKVLNASLAPGGSVICHEVKPAAKARS